MASQTAGNPIAISYAYVNGIGGFTTGNTGSANDNWIAGNSVPESLFKVPFSDASISIANNLEFPTYINGTNTRTKPVQTGYRDITVGLTIPYNQFTFPLIQSMFDEDSWACKVVLDYTATGSSSAKGILFSMPEMCITGDGGLGDIPEGEITIPLTFTAYAPHEIETGTAISDDSTGYDPVTSKPPLSIYVDDIS